MLVYLGGLISCQNGGGAQHPWSATSANLMMNKLSISEETLGYILMITCQAMCTRWFKVNHTIGLGYLEHVSFIRLAIIKSS